MTHAPRLRFDSFDLDEVNVRLSLDHQLVVLAELHPSIRPFRTGGQVAP